MQFMLLLHDDEAAWTGLSEDRQMAIVGEYMAYSDELQTAGAFVSGAPPDPAGSAKIVTGSGIQDGPYADTKEQLGGFYLIEAASMAEAVEWAGKCPAAKTGKVEVRPVPDYGG